MAETSHKNIFTTLEKCGVVLPTHIMNLMTKLEYNSIQAIAKLDSEDFEGLEDTIRSIFCTKKRLAKMEEKDLINLFGPMFFEDPCNDFQFLPGERAAISSAKEMCVTILEGVGGKIPYIDFTAPVFKNIMTPLRSKRPLSSTNSKPNTEESASESVEARNTQSKVSEGKKSLFSYISTWICKNAKKNNYRISIEDFEVDEKNFQIVCKLKHPGPKQSSLKVSVTSEGNWKISNFTRHLKVKQNFNKLDFTNTCCQL